MRRLLYQFEATGCQQALRIGLLRRIKNFHAASLFYHVPLAHDRHLIRQLCNHAHIMRDQKHRASALLLQAAQDFLLVTSQENQPDSAAAAQAHHGLVVSGDRFIATAQASNTLRRELQEAGHTVLAVEMEGAAVAQVCADYQVPFAAMRTISDRADDDAHVDFTRFIETVASRYAEHIVQRWLQAVPH